MTPNRVLLWIVTSVLHVVSYGQSQGNYRFNHVNRADGFPVDFVYGIEQDSVGRIWAISAQGLTTYNGHSGRIYGVKPDSTGLLPAQPYGLYKAKNGKFWITYIDTYVSCFDPLTETFTHYIHDPSDPTSFPPGMVSQYLEDSRGNFWIGTWGGGLARFDEATQTFERFQPREGDPNAIQSTNATSITEDTDGTLFIGTWEGDGFENTLCKLDVENKSFSRFDISGYATENEVEKLKIEAAFRIVHFVKLDELNNLWVGTYSGLFYVDRQARTIHRLTGLDKSILYQKGHVTFDNATACLFEDDQTMWVSTEVGGIMIVDLETHEVKYLNKTVENPSSVGGNIIRDMMKDNYGNIWVATEGVGLDIYVPFEQQFNVLSNEFLKATRQHIAQGLYAVNAHLVSALHNEIVISHGKGISIYHIENGGVEHIDLQEEFAKFANKNPSYLKYVSHNNINFVGYCDEILDGYRINTHVGCIFLSKQTGELTFRLKDFQGRHMMDQYDGDAWHYMIAYDHTNWLGENDVERPSLYHYNTVDQQRVLITRLPERIETGERFDYWKCLKVDSTKLFLRYSANSFLIMDMTDTSYDVYSYLPPYQNIPDSNATDLHIERNGTVWFATENELYSFDHRTGKFNGIKKRLGLTDKDRVHAFYRDRAGTYWIALRYDLVRYDPQTGEVFRFTQKHGLVVGGFVRQFMLPNDWNKVVFDVHYGLLIFDPKKIEFNTRPSSMFISDIVLGKDTLSQLERNEFTETAPSLDWDQNFITFEFASDLLFSTGGKSYQYRLIGLDTSWVQSGSQNKVTYTNLTHGSYQFEARCTDAFGVSSNVLSISFVIDKPFWLKWWFILFEIILVISGFMIYVRWRERKLKFAKIKLEKTVEMRTAQVQEKMQEIEEKKNIIEFKNKELTDSIHYAKRIQQTLLASTEILEKNLPAHFVFYQPKDIVSGDFYWAAKTGSSFHLAICDSTGHGVPGAFMSMLNIRYLYEGIVEKRITSPDLVLNYVRQRLIDNSTDGSKDGMDGTLVTLALDQQRLTYASSQNKPVLLRNGAITILEADKMPVGIGVKKDPFRQFTQELRSGDMLYFFTDGYQDQFGGEKGKKLKNKNFLKLLVEIHTLSPEEQKNHLGDYLLKWKRNFEQVDDILVVGIRIN
jgi:serine phosphatase RsbU (regulator of sigma subunit)/ligand-binding sensor domain-containing protein